MDNQEDLPVSNFYGGEEEEEVEEEVDFLEYSAHSSPTAHLNNAVLENKKRMESYIKGVVKDCDKQIKQLWKVHQDEEREFKIEYTEQIITLFPKWDSDIKKVGDLEDNLTNTFCRQQKTLQQTRSWQSHSLKALKQANIKFLKGMENLEKDKNTVLSSVHNEFKKQIVFLQRKIADG